MSECWLSFAGLLNWSLFLKVHATKTKFWNLLYYELFMRRKTTQNWVAVDFQIQPNSLFVAKSYTKSIKSNLSFLWVIWGYLAVVLIWDSDWVMMPVAGNTYFIFKVMFVSQEEHLVNGNADWFAWFFYLFIYFLERHAIILLIFFF